MLRSFRPMVGHRQLGRTRTGARQIVLHQPLLGRVKRCHDGRRTVELASWALARNAAWRSATARIAVDRNHASTAVLSRRRQRRSEQDQQRCCQGEPTLEVAGTTDHDPRIIPYTSHMRQPRFGNGYARTHVPSVPHHAAERGRRADHHESEPETTRNRAKPSRKLAAVQRLSSALS